MPRRSSREVYDISDPELAREFVAHLGFDVRDDTCPSEGPNCAAGAVTASHQTTASSGPSTEESTT
jgi:hypothetical protein